MERTIDANINRACEGLRVIEDILRFELEKKEFSQKLKHIRHYLRENFSSKLKFLHKRNSISDLGKEFSKIETKRESILDLLKANFYRIEEALRVLEEVTKLYDDLKDFTPTIKSFNSRISIM